MRKEGIVEAVAGDRVAGYRAAADYGASAAGSKGAPLTATGPQANGLI